MLLIRSLFAFAGGEGERVCKEVAGFVGFDNGIDIAISRGYVRVSELLAILFDEPFAGSLRGVRCS